MERVLQVRTRADSRELCAAARALEDKVWSPFGFLNFTDAHQTCYERVLDQYPELQLVLQDETTGEIVALANCIPAQWNFDDPMPEEGWDWLVRSGGRESGSANVLGALAISVPEIHRGSGLATRMIGEMKALCARNGYEALIAPVRPSAKARHAAVPTSDYVDWRDDRGRPYDPWLRSHLSQGGRVVEVCRRSMVVRQRLEFWESWADRRFERSGAYEVAGALVPVEIDLERDVGLYEEPNIWVAYRN